MSDGAISQDEIDALLSGASMGNSGAPVSAPAQAGIDLAPLQNFSQTVIGQLASGLATMTGVSFEAGTPAVETSVRESIIESLPDMVVAVMSDFSAAITGDHIFILNPEFAQKITDLVNKEEGAELDEMALSIISEAVSQHTGSEITELSKQGKVPGLACNPAESLHVPKAMVRFPPSEFVLFSYPLTAEGNSYTLWEAVSMNAAQGMMNALGAGPAAAVESPHQAPAAMSAQSGGFNAMNMNMSGINIPNVQGLEYPSLQGGQGATSTEQGNIGLIMDVFMEMTVELGRTKKQIKEILGMGEGTIIELDKLAGEPVDILVNHKPIAKGEVVVIDENFGVRVTEILSPMERMSELS
jgi:flagellar motor switch protein FliN/FliY